MRERRTRLILQLGAFFGNLISGIGGIASQVVQAVAPTALGVGQQFLQRELDRKFASNQRRQVQAQAVQVLNTPGIAVARLGGTTQPVGGNVQRSTFTPAAFTPAQNPGGNIPLLPVQSFMPGAPARLPSILGPFPLQGPFVPKPQGGTRVANGALLRLPGAPGEPRFAKDEMGRTIMFVPSPDGQGFISVQQARANNLAASKPWWRFNRLTSRFEKISPRRLNPFNFKAAKRAGRRIERTLDAVKELVRIERKMTSGKVRLKKSKKRKR